MEGLSSTAVTLLQWPVDFSCRGEILFLCLLRTIMPCHLNASSFNRPAPHSCQCPVHHQHIVQSSAWLCTEAHGRKHMTSFHIRAATILAWLTLLPHAWKVMTLTEDGASLLSAKQPAVLDEHQAQLTNSSQQLSTTQSHPGTQLTGAGVQNLLAPNQSFDNSTMQSEGHLGCGSHWQQVKKDRAVERSLF